MTIRKTNKPKVQKQPKACDDDLLEQYSPLKIGKIIPTKTEKKSNVFNTFRPKPGECLDYNISETFVKWNVGDTKINVKQTKASYVPAPPEAIKPKKTKKVVKSHGGPPQWKFIDEIWREKQEQLQIQSKREFKQFSNRRKFTHKNQALLMHNRILGMVGPEWFQELSPKQLKTADHLKYCMAQDYKDNTIIHTKENIGSLGLVPRPNSKHILLALNLCCGFDVEFLLILYQLIDPNRSEYSINDRLLLSAVVHLTMTETLRELHIRIPSPPRKKGSISKVIEKPEKKRYKSPYLVPFTFKPEPPKYSGVYENKHFQYPQNPYFSYIDDLYQEMQFTENILSVEVGEEDSDDVELIEDMKNAQKLYNKLPNSTGNVYLMRPTIKQVCIDFQNYSDKPSAVSGESILPHLAELKDSSEICTCLQPLDELEDDCCDFLENCECEGKCVCKEKSKLFVRSLCKRCNARRQHKNAKNIIVGSHRTMSDTAVPIIGGTFVEKECNCLLTYKEKLKGIAARNRFICQRVKYILGGVVMTRLGPVYLISSVFVEPESEVNSESDSSSACTCRTDDKRTRKSDSTEVVSKKSSVAEETDDCECKQELELFLKHKCNCEQCEAAMPSIKKIFINRGIKRNSDGTTVNIIDGAFDQRCDCLQTYLDRMEKCEEYKSRVNARYTIKSQPNKYVITGVYMTPLGPAYCIGGVRVPAECVCGKLMREAEEDEERAKRMAKMPPTGRVKYEISGVKHGSQENSFIISRALPVKDCSCESLFKSYQKAHEECLNTFEEYLEKMKEEMDNLSEKSEEAAAESTDKNDLKEEKSPVKTKVIPVHMVETITYITKISTIFEVFVTDLIEKFPITFDPVIKAFRQNVYGGKFDIGLECPEKKDVTTLLNNTWVSEPELDLVEENEALKRFVILDEIPCDLRSQTVILKKMLASMAQDGFPLAKLPECYKLPHFKLWMELRSGRRWSQKDREYYENLSKFLSKHTLVCYHDVPTPKLNFSRSRAEGLTWNDAKFCRRLMNEKCYTFHRQLKQQMINSAREFFPLTFSYEFPTPTFRDCYFAYLPGKEDDLFVG